MVPVTWTVDYLALIRWWRNINILLYKIYIYIPNWLLTNTFSERQVLLYIILPTVFSWEGCESNLHMMFEPHQILSSIVESIEFIAVGKHYYSHHHQDRRASKQLYVWLWQQLCSEQKPIWKLVYLRMSLGGYPKK